MKKLLFLALLFVFFEVSFAQSVTIDPSNTATNIIDAKSTNKGVMLPRVGDPSSNILNPSAGLMAYNTTTNTPNFYNGSQWQSVTAVSAASMGFKNMVVLKENNVSEFRNWTVPAGVNKIMAEGWGGGGGAGVYDYNNGALLGSGGGAGGYDMNIIEVTPGEVLQYVVGVAGRGSITGFSQTDGGTTSISKNGNWLLHASGGQSSISGLGGGSFFAGVRGENGGNLEVSYGNASATNYNLIVKLGSGGSAYKGGKGGKGAWFVSQNSTSLLFSKGDGLSSSGAGTPGGGAGGSFNNFDYGAWGGTGLLIIYY